MLLRAAALILPLLAALPVRAEVASFEVQSRVPAFGGRSFAAGTAELITARATIALDPANPHNAVIKDLDLAARNAQGKVEATTDVVILRPQHPNGTLIFEVVNRGRKLLTSWSQDTGTEAGIRLTEPGDAGNGFLLDQGFTLVWAGWQPDAPKGPGYLSLQVPTVQVTGPTREELQFDGSDGPKRVTLSYPAADPARPRLSFRTSADAAPQSPGNLLFRFIDPQTVEITPPPGAPASTLYDFAYDAGQSRVTGMALAVIRDIPAFLRHETGAANPLAPVPANGDVPAEPGLQRVIGLGISQSGRVLRDVLYYGMTVDEQGLQVFDGLMPIIPGARRSFTNARFAQPGRNPGPQLDRLYPVLQFPFTYPTLEDPILKRRDGLLRRCTETSSCPRIIQADSEFEFWGSQASLVVTDPAGNPVDMPDNVRLFLFTGTPHSNLWDAVATTRADCALPLNPNNAGPSIRALLVAMQGWIAEGRPPPASRYPSRAQGTLVSPLRAYPPIPGLDYQARYVRAQAITQGDEGPEVHGEYRLWVPRSGPDGNAIAGLRLPIVAAPRATYTGWNPVAGLDGDQALCTQMGGVVALPAHATPGDARPALDELYPTPDAYIDAVSAAAAELVHSRLMLPRDADAALAAAKAGVLDKLGGR